MQNEIESTLLLLADADVRFLVVGGVAVVVHGHLRLTADLDLVVSLEEQNVRKALDALERHGFRPRAPIAMSDFADAATRRRWIDEKHLQVFSLWHPRRPGFEVDLFVKEPFDFEAAWNDAALIELQERQIRIASIEALIEMKSHAGRPRDLEDIKALRKLCNDEPRK